MSIPVASKRMHRINLPNSDIRVGQRENSLSISGSDRIPQNRVKPLIFRQCGSTARGAKLSPPKSLPPDAWVLRYGIIIYR
jgi:hypothetical protein